MAFTMPGGGLIQVDSSSYHKSIIDDLRGKLKEKIKLFSKSL